MLVARFALCKFVFALIVFCWFVTCVSGFGGCVFSCGFVLCVVSLVVFVLVRRLFVELFRWFILFAVRWLFWLCLWCFCFCLCVLFGCFSDWFVIASCLLLAGFWVYCLGCLLILYLVYCALFDSLCLFEASVFDFVSVIYFGFLIVLFV